MSVDIKCKLFMKTIAICSPQIKKIFSHSLVENFSFGNIDFTIGLLPIDYHVSRFKSDEDVLVEVKSFSCNYRDRSLIIAFNEQCRTQSKREMHFYSPFGSDFVAVVIRTAPNVKKLKIGDVVIPNCSYNDPVVESNINGIPSNFASQRMQVFPEAKLIKIPDSMPYEVAASFSIASQTAYSMIRKAMLKDYSKVLVTSGTSNTSLAVINALKHRNVEVYATSSNENNAKYLLELGVDKFVPLNALFNNNLKDYVTAPYFDVIIDPFFDLNLSGIISNLACGGKYIYCGLFDHNQHIMHPNFYLKEDYKKVLKTCLIKNISLIGNCLGLSSDLEKAIEEYSSSKYKIIIDSVYSDSELLNFMERSFKTSERIGKVVFNYE